MTRRIAALLVALAATLACSSREPAYEEEIAGWRAEKDRYMRSSESPLPAAKRDSFPPLPYFPISATYRVPAALEVVRTNDVIEMSLSSGERQKMRRVGFLDFTFQGQPLRLTAFVDAAKNDMRRLFVPFGDLTNGAETYQGGRYLDLDRTATGIYDLDFNRAYHPFCVFNAQYICPVPPPENRMKVAIRAGEKLPLL
jgi:uncharacterized protein (DUF1684 family)